MLNPILRGLLPVLLSLAGTVSTAVASQSEGAPTGGLTVTMIPPTGHESARQSDLSIQPRAPIQVPALVPMALPSGPAIVRQPVSQGAYAGDTVTLSVQATPPLTDPNAVLTYQWLAGTNQTPIANGAYNSTNGTLPQLVLTNVATGYSGQFRVAVSSGTNTVVSEPATLSVVVGVASRLRLGMVSVTTNAAPGAGLQVFSFPVILSVLGPDRGVAVTWTYDPKAVRDLSFVAAAEAPTNTLVRTTSSSGRFSFVYSLTNDPSVGFTTDQQIGRLVLTTSSDRDPAQALAAARLVPVQDDPSTNIARPFLPLPSGSDRVLGTNLADLVTFPLNILMTPQVIPNGSVTLNRQTGYFEQRAQVVNLRSESLADVLLIVTGLTNDTRGVLVSLASSVGPVGTPPNPSVFVGPMDSFAIRPITFEYYVSDGRASSIGTPGYVTEFAMDSTIQTPVGRRSLVPVTYRPVLTGGVLLEFPTLTNFSYYIRYSDSLNDFSAQDNTNSVIRTARPAILGNGRKVQWLDHGLPRTEGAPTNRFYRVLEFR